MRKTDSSRIFISRDGDDDDCDDDDDDNDGEENLSPTISSSRFSLNIDLNTDEGLGEENIKHFRKYSVPRDKQDYIRCVES